MKHNDHQLRRLVRIIGLWERIRRGLAVQVMMFVSGCVACPNTPLATSLPYWRRGERTTAKPPAIYLPAQAYDGSKATTSSSSSSSSSFYISDILYPSTIPLAGTLPHQRHDSSPSPRVPPHEGTTGTAGSAGTGEVEGKGTPCKPAVRSVDLKFGIDRILSTNAFQTQGLYTKPPKTNNLASPTTVISYCACATSPTSYDLLYAPMTSPYSSSARALAHAHHTGLPPAHHHGACTQPSSAYIISRPSDFPGPYAVLASDSAVTSPSQHSKRKRSWSRAVFSNLQRKGLEKRFDVQKYVTKPDRRQLAAMLGLTDAQVKVWFQNRRMKWRHAEDAKRKRDESDQSKAAGENEAKEEDVDVVLHDGNCGQFEADKDMELMHGSASESESETDVEQS